MSTCRRCHRSIRDSWAISPACLKREQLAAMERAGEGYSQPIRDKAAALLTSKGVQHQTGGLYLVLASDGQARYRVTSWTCNCRAGELGRRCCHVLAVAMYEAVLRVGGLTGPFEGFKTSRKAA